MVDNILSHFYLGVDFLFVLSGFIIFYTVKSSPKKPFLENYAWSRFIRVYVPYLPIGIAMALAYTALPNMSAAPREWGWLTSITLFPSERPTALSVAWTLRHEIVFYAFFGLLYLLGCVVYGLVAWIVVIAVSAVFAVTDQSPALLPILSPLNLEFSMGVAVAWIVLRGVRIAEWALALGAFGMFGLWVALGTERTLSPIVGLGLAFIVLLIVQWEKYGCLTVPHWLGFLGDASYSIYLVHNVVISIFVRIIMVLYPSSDYYAFIVVLAAAGTAGGIAYHLMIEKPALRAVRHRLARRQSRRAGVNPAASEGGLQ